MTFPIYQEHQAPQNKPDQAHSGLWFERFFAGYDTDWSIQDNTKSQWLKSLSGLAGQDLQLEKYKQRLIALMGSLKGRSLCFQNDWHFVTGMGNPHPVENGLSWHPTLAVPYLCGAAVKGLVRAWVELNEDNLNPEQQATRLKRWFGTASKDEVAEQAGGFIFFDAIPEQRPHLITDIMTPHMGQWYAEGNNATVHSPDKLPADWHEPVPVPFLAVKQIKLIFHIAPRTSDFFEELDSVCQALNEALTWLGAGAKTAAGYGYMTQDLSFQEQLKRIQTEQQQQAALANLSPEQRQIETLRQSLETCRQKSIKQDISGPLYQEFRNKVSEASSWSREDRESLAELGREIISFINAKKSLKAKALMQQLLSDD